MRPRLTLKTVAVLGASVLALPVLTSAGYAAAPSRATVAGSLPGWVASARQTGAPAASKKMSVNVVLPLRNAAAAENLAANVSNPKSAAYGHYQTPAQFNAQFAPTAAQVDQVRSFLSGQGLHVDSVAAGNRWVSVTGTVAQLDKAFGTTLRTYSYQGTSAIAPARAMTVPTSVAPLVSGVIGMDTYTVRHHTNTAKPVASGSSAPTASPRALSATNAPAASPAAGSQPPPPAECSEFWDQHEQKVPLTYGRTHLPTVPCGYGPLDLRKAYGISSLVKAGLTGKGITVAITDAYAQPTMLEDLNTWSALNGVPKMKPGQYSQAGTADPSTFGLQDECGGEVGWNEEEALDVEAVHGIAPGAKIHYVGAKDCDTGLDDALNYIVQTHSADIVSNSWGNFGEFGFPEEIALEHSIFLQGAVEGIGFYFSSGDDGDDTDGFAKPQVDYPSTDPLVTSVGGTSLATRANGTTLFQTGWGDTVDPVDFSTKPASLESPLPGPFFFGGGGGTSRQFTQPFYQRNVVPDRFSRIHHHGANRVTPDVSLDADPETGYIIGLQDGGTPFAEFVIGGTSLSSPLFAGFQALASQGRKVAIGFANPMMYNLGSHAFTDVVNPKNPVAISTESGSFVLVLGQDTSLVAVKGFDNTTGLGTPNGGLFLAGEKH
ncbi:MAG TPA: S53 family peptidase [Micromonosporaceae bacterium]|nr:S53 family peptidase [Micromonosporaceae bacterium]